MDKIILGRYLPGDSLLYHLDPRGKFLLTFYFVGIVFLANNVASYAFLLAFVIFAVYLSKINFGFFIKGLKPVFWLILFTVALQLLFTPSSHPIWHWGIFTFSKEGLVIAGYIFMRFVLIIFISTLLTLTTEALDLTDAIEFFLKPLKIFKFPVHEMTLMLALALRFVPTMMDEAEVIMNAQRARGVSFSEGPIMQRLKNLISLLIPLFISSYDRAPQLATAMEARGYQGGENRTKYRELTWKKIDTVVLLSFLVLFSTVYLLRG